MNKGTLSPNRISLKCKKNKILFLLKIQQSYFQKSSYNLYALNGIQYKKKDKIPRKIYISKKKRR